MQLGLQRRDSGGFAGSFGFLPLCPPRGLLGDHLLGVNDRLRPSRLADLTGDLAAEGMQESSFPLVAFVKRTSFMRGFDRS